MTTSPHGYPFEHIDYDVGLMNALHGHLVDAADRIDVMQLVLRNTADNLEGRGRALTVAKTMAGEVAAALTVPASRVERISAVVLAYGRSAETHAGRANALMADVSDAIAALAASEAALTIAQTDLSAWERGDAYGSWRSGEEDPSRATLVRDGVYRDAVDTAETARTLASAALDDAWTAWERAYECWDHAYARAVAGLAGVDDGYTSPGDRAFLTALADAETVAEVAAVWGGLTDAQKEHYVERYPDLVGNLDGIPYEYRIAANVAALQNASKTSWGEPTDTEIRSLLEELRRGGVPVSLDLFDKNQATAAVLYVDGFIYDENALVDPLTGVTNVNVLIGGMMTELNQIGDWGGTSTNMNKFIDRDGGKGATIAWFGYDSPNLATVGSMDQAITGAETLSGFLRGLDAVAPHEAVTTVIGHSYGSTTAFLAVGSAGDNLGVDNLIAIGSAGLTDRALGTDPDARVDYAGTTVYASTSPEDNWATKGRWAPPLANPLTWGTHPIDPGSLDGVVSFDSDGGYAPNRDGSEPTAQHHDGDHLLQTPGHGTHDEGDFPIGTTGHPGGYLQEGSESFANIVEIIESGRPLTTAGGYGSDDWWLW